VTPTPTATPLPPEISRLAVDPAAPLVIVDVDEVLAMFVRGFERFLGRRGLEMRLDRFALFQNIFRPGEAEHLDLAAGRVLFDAFFETDVEAIEVAPGASEALAALAAKAGVVVLTNAPGHSRDARASWLEKHRFPYPLIVNSGAKGPVVAALARARARPSPSSTICCPTLTRWPRPPRGCIASRWSLTSGSGPWPSARPGVILASTTGRACTGRSPRRWRSEGASG